MYIFFCNMQLADFVGTNIGHRTITNVGFALPGKNQTFFTVATTSEFGNFLLRDYVTAEINLLSGLVGYKQFESSPMTIGGNPAHKIVYSYSLVKNGVEAGQIKAMEIVTIHNLVPFFIEYAILPNDYQKYLPIAQKMIRSFQFTDNIL